LVIDNMEEFVMGKRNNVSGDVGTGRGGGRLLVFVLVAVVAVFVGVQAVSGHLQSYVPPTAAGDVSVGAWVVAVPVVLFLVWCVSGSKGGRG